MAFLRRSSMPPALAGALHRDETVLANARLSAGGWLAATRFGLWQVAVDADPVRWSWPLVSKVRWQPPVLTITVAEVVGVLAGADVIADGPPLDFAVAGTSKLTDIVHQRVRSGIVSSTHHQTSAGGVWLVLRRVPGKNGLSAQIRADRGTSLESAADEVTDLVQQSMVEFGVQ